MIPSEGPQPFYEEKSLFISPDMKSPGVVREVLTLKNVSGVQQRAPGTVLGTRHTFHVYFSVILRDCDHPRFLNEEKFGD